MPDKYPLCPGHTLVISKDHFACYGAAPAEVQQELDNAAATARAFLHSAYDKHVLAWENGVSGQSVFHAHLHLIPIPLGPIPLSLEDHPDVALVQSWETVQAYFVQHGTYRYLEVGDQKRLLSGHSPALRRITEFLAHATGLTYGRGGWVKTSTPEDVAEVDRRFRAWSTPT